MTIIPSSCTQFEGQRYFSLFKKGNVAETSFEALAFSLSEEVHAKILNSWETSDMIRDDLKIPGLNIQSPWSRMILSGQKTIETRNYPLPERFKGKMIAIIETPGKDRSLGKAKMIGIVVFSDSFLYENREQWLNDIDRHLVQPIDPLYKFTTSKPKYAWVVQTVMPLETFVPPPKKRGIIFATECVIPGQLLPA